MRTYLDVIDGKGVTKKLALFSSKSESGVHVVVRTEQSADPIALDKSYQALGHVVAPDQGGLWEEMVSHPRKINYDLSHNLTLSSGISGEAIWFD